MSSLFNKSASVNNTPSWCKPPPEVDLDCLPLPPGAMPPCVPEYLVAYCKWIDHDPDAYLHLAEAFQIPFTGPGWRWSGESSNVYPRLRCVCRWSGIPSKWRVELTVYRDADDFETQNWIPLPAVTTDPLHIHPPRIENVPNEDYQEVELYG